MSVIYIEKEVSQVSRHSNFLLPCLPLPIDKKYENSYLAANVGSAYIDSFPFLSMEVTV